MRINFESVFNKSSGYGKVSIKTVKYLEKLGHEISCQQLFGTPSGHDEIAHLFGPPLEDARTVSHIVPHDKKFDVLWTIAEFKPVSYSWKYALDKANAVCTQSEFSRDCLSSVTDRDIQIVPNGIEPDFGLAEGNAFPTKDLEGNDAYRFRFFSMFEWVPRKQGKLLLRAFCEEFSEDKEVELWIKTHGAGWQNPMYEIPMILKDYPGMKDRVFYIRNYINDIQYLYKLFDSYVLPCAGEGFGLTFLEAMLCGLKPIGPNHGGGLEFMNDKNSYLVECGDWEPLVPFSKGLFAPDSKWKVPLKGQLKVKMRQAYEDNEKLPKFFQDQLRQKWTWENTTKKLVKVLES